MPSASNTLHSARSESRGDSYIRGGGARFLDTALSQGGSPLLPLRAVLLRWSRERETGKVLTFAALLVPTPRPSRSVAQSPANPMNMDTPWSSSPPAL